MFICSVRATTLRFIGVLLLSCAALVGLALAGSASVATAKEVSVHFEGVKTAADRQRFLSECGITVTGDAESSGEFTLPKTADAVLLGYNEIQKKQGLDLTPYAGKTVTRYTYRVSGEGEGVYANLIVYRGRVVGADLTATGSERWVKPLCGGMAAVPPQ